MKKFSKRDIKIFISGALAAVLLASGIGAAGYLINPNSPTGLGVQSKIKKISNIIQQNFLYDTDDEKLADGIYSGLIEGLDDKYAHYYNAEDYKKANENTQGEYKGIGIIMLQEKDSDEIQVGHVYEDSPADKAGMKTGDVFYKVNDEEVTGYELSAISDLIQNSDSDKVKITVYRSSSDSYIDFEMTPEEIEVPVVSSEMKDDQIGYIAIYQFTAKTASQFEDAYNDMLDQGAKSLVIDLRDNPGGLLTGVVDTLNVFMPKGLLVYTKDKKGHKESYESDCENPIDIPLVVLINENSASASEIFAGAVKDREVGTLVGTTSYGKGIVQSMFSLGDGSYIKLTTAEYYTPSGENIHGKGITPDIEVEASDNEEDDAQLDQALATAKEKMEE